jgi:hypothetical protein
MKPILAALIGAAAIMSQTGTASAQYYGPPGGYYYYGSPAGLCCALHPVNLGWVYTRSQPAGHGGSHPAMQMADGTLACEYSNYRPMRDRWCRRIW